MALVPKIKHGDWKSVDQAISKLASLKLGPNSAPTFISTAITGLTASRLVATDANKVLVSLADPLIIAKGGTGAATLTDHGILLGSGTSAITSLGAASNGQIPIGNTGADPVLATITGTANRVTVNNSAGGITLTGPQDIHTGANVAFARVTTTDIWSDSHIDILAALGEDINIDGRTQLTLRASAAAGFVEINPGGRIDLQPANNGAQYIKLSTAASQTTLRFVGQNGLITADSGTIDFDDENLTTAGEVLLDVAGNVGRLTLRGSTDTGEILFGTQTDADAYMRIIPRLGVNYFEMKNRDFLLESNTKTLVRVNDGTGLWDFKDNDLTTTGTITADTLAIGSQTIADDARGLSSITKLVTNAKSDGIAGYFEGHIDGATDGPTYAVGAWLNIDSGSTTYDVRALDIGIYESGADCTGGNAYGLAIHMEFDSANSPAAIYPLRLNTNVAGATPDALIFAANKAAVPIIESVPGIANAYTKIVVQDGTVYRIPVIDEASPNSANITTSGTGQFAGLGIGIAADSDISILVRPAVSLGAAESWTGIFSNIPAGALTLTGNATTVQGLQFEIIVDQLGANYNIVSLYGMQGNVGIVATLDPWYGGTITNAICVRAAMAWIDTGHTPNPVVTNAIHLEIPAPTIFGVDIGTHYGIKMENITGATTNWAIYSVGPDSFHGGDLAFGQTDKAERIGSDADGTLDLYAGTSIDLHANTIVSGFVRLAQKAGTATDGDLWNDSTQEALQTFVSGIEQTLVGAIFTQTADQTIANTTTETTLFGTGVGTLTLPANFWTVGKTIRIEIHGDFADTGNPTAEIQAYYGATSLIDSGAITLSGLAGTEEWETEVVITCRSTGVSGTVETVIDWEYETSIGSSAIERLDVAGVLRTINTTASGVLDVTFQWGTAAAANTLHSHVGFVEVLN